MEYTHANRRDLILYFHELTRNEANPLSTVEMARLLNLGTPIPLLSQTMSEAYKRLNPDHDFGDLANLSWGDLFILAHLRDENYDLSKVGGQMTRLKLDDVRKSPTIERVMEYACRIFPEGEKRGDVPIIRDSGRGLEFLKVAFLPNLSVVRSC